MVVTTVTDLVASTKGSPMNIARLAARLAVGATAAAVATTAVAVP
ncbi:fasciclin, partial [Micromonospora chalcea]